MKRVLIVSHADADGHVIAEQLRRNLSAISGFSISTVVDPARTRDHRAWLHLDAITEIDAADIVFFVDLMFAPASFVNEAGALTQFVAERPLKQFFVLDHHPLPLERLRRAPNLRAVYRSDVADCTFGPRSRLMVLAALLEKQPTRVRAESDAQRLLAEGVKRAAAIGGPLPGDKLLALMRFDRWAGLIELGREDADAHRLPRGFRPAATPLSNAHITLDKLASDLLKSPSGPGHRGGADAMSYDLDLLNAGAPPTPLMARYEPSDLEAITTLLELAAIYLTRDPTSSFTTQELIDEAVELGGDAVKLHDIDLKIVLGKAGFLKKLPAGRFRLK